MKKSEQGHPGPYCTRCRKPFGPEKPIGYSSSEGQLKKFYACQTVETNSKTFSVCLDCMRSELQKKTDKFTSSLSPDQARQFEEINRLMGDIHSYSLLMS